MKFDTTRTVTCTHQTHIQRQRQQSSAPPGGERTQPQAGWPSAMLLESATPPGRFAHLGLLRRVREGSLDELLLQEVGERRHRCDRISVRQRTKAGRESRAISTAETQQKAEGNESCCTNLRRSLAESRGSQALTASSTSSSVDSRPGLGHSPQTVSACLRCEHVATRNDSSAQRTATK